MGFINKRCTTNETQNSNLINQVLHTIHISSVIPEVRLTGFLQSLKQTKMLGILWTDRRNIRHIKHEVLRYQNQITCEVMDIDDLLNNFTQRNNNFSFLDISIRSRIVHFLRSELLSRHGRAAYATDILRMIVLQQYGGLYIDSNIRCISKTSHDQQDYKNANVMYLAREGNGHHANQIGAQNYKLYNALLQKPDIKFHPHECSAILGRKGSVFFDFVLYNFYDQYMQDPLFSNSTQPLYFETRIPKVINCMMVAQYLMEIKFNLENSSFIFNTSPPNRKSQSLAYTTENYKAVLEFEALGYKWEKYYKHSHRHHNTSEIREYEHILSRY